MKEYKCKQYNKNTPKRTNNELPDKYSQTSHKHHANIKTYTPDMRHHEAEKLTL